MILLTGIAFLDLLRRSPQEIPAFRPDASVRARMDNHSAMDHLECSVVSRLPQYQVHDYSRPGEPLGDSTFTGEFLLGRHIDSIHPADILSSTHATSKASLANTPLSSNSAFKKRAKKTTLCAARAAT